MKTGSIPKNVTYFCRPAVEIEFRWDDISVEDFVKTTVGMPAYVANADNPKTCKTGLEWMNRHSRKWCPTERTYIEDTRSGNSFTVENIRLTDVRLIGLELRSQGGRAYKALISERYVFDFREDVLLDAMLNGGIKDNGVLPGEYIFASVGSEMKLIRIGSLLHAKMIESTEFNRKEHITQFDIGGVYSNKVSSYIYCGKVHTQRLDIEWTKSSVKRFYSSREEIDYTVPPRSLALIKEKAKHLFIEILQHVMKDGIDLSTLDISYYNYKFYDKLPKSIRIKNAQLEIASIDELKEICPPTGSRYNSQYYELLESQNSATALNASTAEGYIHPKIKEIIKKYETKI